MTNYLLLLSLAGTLASCGTITGAISKKRPVSLMLAPSDIEVKANGEPVEVTSEVFDIRSGDDLTLNLSTTTSYATKGVRLPYKKPVTLELYSPSAGKRATIELKSRASGLFFWGNLFSFPILGHIVDGVTKNNHLLKPRYIDVDAALAGKPIKEWRSQSKLKRLQKRKMRKG